MLDFIELFNAVAAVSKPSYANARGASCLQDRLADLGIDSLDGMVMVMYFCELYGIDEANSKEWQVATVGEVHDMLMAHKTREPESVKSAMEQIR